MILQFLSKTTKPNVQIPKALSFASYLALRYGISVENFSNPFCLAK